VTPSSSKYATRRLRISSSDQRRNGTGADDGSPGSGPAITSNRRAMSPTVRAIGPTTPSWTKGPADGGNCPVEGMWAGGGVNTPNSTQGGGGCTGPPAPAP